MVEKQDVDAVVAIVSDFLKEINARTGPLTRKWRAWINAEPEPFFDDRIEVRLGSRIGSYRWANDLVISDRERHDWKEWLKERLNMIVERGTKALNNMPLIETSTDRWLEEERFFCLYQWFENAEIMCPGD